MATLSAGYVSYEIVIPVPHYNRDEVSVIMELLRNNGIDDVILREVLPATTT